MLTMRPCRGHHALQHEVAHVERAVQVDGDELVPELGRGVDEVDEPVPAGIVHQDVGRTHLVLELRRWPCRRAS